MLNGPRGAPLSAIQPLFSQPEFGAARKSQAGAFGRPSVGRPNADTDPLAILDAERLSPLVDRVGDALVEPLGLVAVELDVGQRLAARRRHVRPERVVEGLGQRLGVLLAV